MRSILRVRGIVVSISVPIFLLNFMLLIYVTSSSLSPFTFPRFFLVRLAHDRQARSHVLVKRSGGDDPTDRRLSRWARSRRPRQANSKRAHSEYAAADNEQANEPTA